MEKWISSIYVALFLSSSFVYAATITVTDVAGDALLSNTTTNATLNFGTLAHLNIFENTYHQTQPTYIAFDISSSKQLMNCREQSSIAQLSVYIAIWLHTTTG